MSEAAFPRLRKASVAYPVRETGEEGWLDGAFRAVLAAARAPFPVSPRRFGTIVPAVDRLSQSYMQLSPQEFGIEVQRLRERLRLNGISEPAICRAFAIVREVAGRTIGMRHHDVQLIGGLAMLNGMIAEMDTGEGKTLTATLPATAAALAGIPVHVVTANDYLAARDAAWMSPIYEALGLRATAVVQRMSDDERASGYRGDIVYCTAKQLMSDYLRDRLDLQCSADGLLRSEFAVRRRGDQRSLFLRGLQFALIDEADSVLIDEAQTPLIISRPATSSVRTRLAVTAVRIAENLEAVRDFNIVKEGRDIALTDHGRRRIGELTVSLGGIWTSPGWREEFSLQALAALHLFVRDRDYIVRDGEIEILDGYSGRTMPDRAWERGLHQMVQAKEECAVTVPSEAVARISHQRFFQRYVFKCGMTGTAREVREEVWRVYGMDVVRIPTHHPTRRRSLGRRILRSAEEKWALVVSRVVELHRQGRPVLVGTRSISDSERLGRLLGGAGIPHRILNARQDKEEAQIVAAAGQMGAVTVATNMAGRGTDIVLGPKVAAIGGLAVISTELHEARRIDRQLFGRCGRQGDPGDFEEILSLDDRCVVEHASSILRRIARTPLGRLGLRRLVMRRAQHAATRRNRIAREELIHREDQMDRLLAFSGRP